MGRIKYLLGVLILAVCISESFSQIAVQNFTSYAKACSDCNSTNADCNAKAGHVLCSCKSGFVGDGLNCTKFVFCDSFPCCPQGFYWDNANKKCVDINECLSERTHGCFGKSHCINRNGIYLCNDPKTPPCPTTACSSDKDCVKTVNSDGSATTDCIDPCVRYQEVDGSRRLYTISSTGRFITDRNLFGWHRYKNGLRIREGCVGALKCGSLEPLSLSSHPTLSEGVKSIPLINNLLTSCTTGPSILVKACPGGYYVYKFSGLLKFDVYCTEVAPIFTTTTARITTNPTTTSTTSTTTTTTEPTTTTTPPTTSTTSTTTTTTEPTTTTIPTSTSTTTADTTTSTTTEPTTTTTPTSTSTTTTEPTTTITPNSTSTTSTTTEPTTTTTPITTKPSTSTTTLTTQPSTSTTTESTTSTTTLTTQPTTITTTVPNTSPTTQPSTTTTITTTTQLPPISTDTTPNIGTTPTRSIRTTTNGITSSLPIIQTTLKPSVENITVTTVKSRSVLSVRVLSQIIDNKEVKSLEINETTTVDIEMKTISPSEIHIKNTTSISPTSILIIVGGTEPESLSNHTDTTITTSEITVPNTEQFALDSYCSKPAVTNTITETSAVAGNTCSKFTSASTTTTITTTEEVIVLGPDGFSKSCPYF